MGAGFSIRTGTTYFAEIRIGTIWNTNNNNNANTNDNDNKFNNNKIHI